MTVGVKVTSVPMIQGRHAKAPNVVTEVARELVSPSAYWLERQVQATARGDASNINERKQLCDQ